MGSEALAIISPGLEFALRKNLMGPRNIQIFLECAQTPQTSRALSDKTGVSRQRMGSILQSLCFRGLLRSIPQENGIPLYAAPGFSCEEQEAS